jgi:hypothetical protein
LIEISWQLQDRLVFQEQVSMAPEPIMPANLRRTSLGL